MLESPIPEIPHDPAIVEVTQKIEFDREEIIGGDSNEIILTHNKRSSETKITGHSIKKFLFPGKKNPDEYVKSNSIVCMMDSIPALEKELELQDINSNYTLKRQIAEGAQGVIWTAFDKSLKRDIIVKATKSNSHEKQVQKDVNSFVCEARIIAQLDHPSIAPIYGIYSGSENKLHLAMKHIHGKTLKSYLESIAFLYKRDGIEQFSEKKSILTRIEYLIRVCEAVDYAHCKGIVHRDLKPENIIIGNYSEVYVMDWGLACLLNPEILADDEVVVGMYPRNELVGTPCYIAPELIKGGLCSHKSDIFSLGMILFEIVTFERAVPGETVNEVLRNIVHCNYRPFKHRFLKSKLSDDLKAIIDKATCESLSKRYKTANEMAEDLKSYVMRSETVARPDNFSRKWLRAISNHAVLASSVILSILLCLTIIALYGMRVQNLLVKKQKRRESMLTHFQYGVVERSNDLNNAIRYFETQLTNTVNHVEHVLNSKADKMNRKMLVSSEIIKHMQLTSNSKFQKQTIKNKGGPIIWIFAAFKDGSILSYPKKKKYAKKCDLSKFPWYKKDLNKKDGIIWSKPFKCAESSKIMLCCLQRISDKKNNSLGVIGINIDLDYIKKYLIKDVISGMKRYLVNKKGEIIFSGDLKYKTTKINPKTNTLISKKIFFNEEFQRAIKEKRLEFETTKYNNIYIFGINHIPSLDYYYIEQISKKTLQEVHGKHAH